MAMSMLMRTLMTLAMRGTTVLEIMTWVCHSDMVHGGVIIGRPFPIPCGRLVEDLHLHILLARRPDKPTLHLLAEPAVRHFDIRALQAQLLCCERGVSNLQAGALALDELALATEPDS
eukprot:7540635-Pyramimonas_sp.AAC.2